MDHVGPGGPGLVQVLPAADTAISQAQAAVAELQPLSALNPDWDWSRCLVIALEWSYLNPVQSLCELEGDSGAAGQRGVHRRVAPARNPGPAELAETT